MRGFALASLLLSVSLTTAADDDKELKRFQGDWQVVSATRDAETIKGDAVKGQVWQFDGNTVRRLDIKDEATITLNTLKKPAPMDIKDKDGKVVQGIYKFTGDDKLTICGRSDGVRPKEFDASKGSGAILFKLERVKKK